jgi:hypothetical protein
VETVPSPGAPGCLTAPAKRIARLLLGLERARRAPNRREAYHLREALARLAEGHLEQAEDAIAKAERPAPIPVDSAHALSTNNTPLVMELREQLRAILATAAPGRGSHWSEGRAGA